MVVSNKKIGTHYFFPLLKEFAKETIRYRFNVLFVEFFKDCAYVKIWDENGHLYLTCSHHDGTCHFEIKEITDEGYEYYDRWNYGCDNRNRSIRL